MFGILFFIFMGICGIIAACRMAWTDMQVYKYQEEHPGKNFDDYWFDANAHMISRKYGRPCFESNSLGIKGHKCLIDSKTYEVIKDYTEEKNNRVKELVILSDNPNITAYKWDFAINEIDKNIYGNRYIDKTTGKECVVRSFAVPYGENRSEICCFYMSLDNGYLLRITDGERVRWNEDEKRHANDKYKTDYVALKEAVEKFIVDFNKKQSSNRNYFNLDKNHDFLLDTIYNTENLEPYIPYFMMH